MWEAQEVGADYIVVGAEGMSRLESIIIGNVVQEVLRRADRTVLLVDSHRSPDDPMLSPRSECVDPEVALAEHEATPETSSGGIGAGCDRAPEWSVNLLLLLFGGVCLCLLVRTGQKRDPTRGGVITY